MTKSVKRSKMTLDKLAQITQREFLSMDEKIDGIRENMATKDDLEDLRGELKDDIRQGTVGVLRAVDTIATKFDKAEKEEAAHSALHKRVTDELHHHDQRIKKLEARV